MARKPPPQPPARWSIYKFAANQTWLGTVEAPDVDAAIEIAAKEFKVPANKLLAVRRG